MNNEKQDLNIFYYGGSGGFFLLHLLILSGDYTCHFHYENINISTYSKWFSFFKQVIYKNQWTIGTEWKNTESWPLNSVTQVTELGKHKIYFTCNDVSQWQSLPGHKVFLYTDLRTELRLSWYKKAFTFNKERYKDKNVTIPEAVKRARYVLEHADIVDGEKYVIGAKRAMEIADTKIKLQELVKDAPTVLKSIGVNCNDSQSTHIKNWLQLHPTKLLAKTNLI